MLLAELSKEAYPYLSISVLLVGRFSIVCSIYDMNDLDKCTFLRNVEETLVFYLAKRLVVVAS